LAVVPVVPVDPADPVVPADPAAPAAPDGPAGGWQKGLVPGRLGLAVAGTTIPEALAPVGSMARVVPVVGLTVLVAAEDGWLAQAPRVAGIRWTARVVRETVALLVAPAAASAARPPQVVSVAGMVPVIRSVRPAGTVWNRPAGTAQPGPTGGTAIRVAGMVPLTWPAGTAVTIPRRIRAVFVGLRTARPRVRVPGAAVAIPANLTQRERWECRRVEAWPVGYQTTVQPGGTVRTSPGTAGSVGGSTACVGGDAGQTVDRAAARPAVVATVPQVLPVAARAVVRHRQASADHPDRRTHGRAVASLEP
jgi:hypothetical protein